MTNPLTGIHPLTKIHPGKTNNTTSSIFEKEEVLGDTAENCVLRLEKRPNSQTPVECRQNSYNGKASTLPG